jgi:hypothetical protein
MIASTTRCKGHGHAEFVLEIDDNAVPHQHVTQIIQTLEGMVAQGSVFKPGETFQIGWMITQVQQYDKDHRHSLSQTCGPFLWLLFLG